MKEKNAFAVMAGLIGLIKPMLLIMAAAILMGCIGNLMAAFITILGGYALAGTLGFETGFSLTMVFIVILIFALLRGVMRYAEQSCNHFIAFKLLAGIRHKVFAILRKLAPAKLDGSDKGNLISIITSDIELLEVFYAHTISPVAIAAITSLIMCMFVGSFNWRLGVMLAVFHILVGIVIPVCNSKYGQKKGQEYRALFGNLNTKVLDNLYGLEEILQFQQEKNRMEQMAEDTKRLEQRNKSLKKAEGIQKIAADTVILSAGVITVLVSGYLVSIAEMDFAQALIASIAVMSSFGPTAALSSLSNNLNQTLASGRRVLKLLEETPAVEEVKNGVNVDSFNISCENITFSYETKEEKQEVLHDFSARFYENGIHGILGKSGCGKSTLLKLLMRFYETKQGGVYYGKEDVNNINTSSLRNGVSYVTQETFLFADTIENNIKVANGEASLEEVMEAAKKASIHDFILSLPNGYATRLSELGNSVSGGERQRIGIARAFLHDSKVILLDEPTSNIDSLNEGMILKSLVLEKKNKTIVLVSHRKSTMGIADEATVM